MRMVLSRNEMQADARNAEKPADKAKLWAVVATMDTKILERFTQLATKGKVETRVERVESTDLGKYVLEYLGETYGPDAVQHCLEWVDKRVRFQSSITKS